jgi:hypothetical protein
MDVIGYFSDLVGELDEEGIYELLSTLPYEDLEYEPTIQAFLQVTFEAGRKDFTRIVIESFGKYNVREDDFPLTTEIFTYGYEDDLLGFVASCYPKITTVDHMTNIIKQGDDSGMIRIAEKILNIHGEMDYTLYISCLNLAETDNNYNLALFFRQKVQKTTTSAPPPSWMIASGLRKIPKIDLPEFDLPPVEAAAEMIIRGLGYMGLSPELLDYTEEEFKDIDLESNPSLSALVHNRKIQNIRKAFEDQYARSDDEEKRQLLKPIFEHEYQTSLAQDLEYFRILGPINQLPMQQDWSPDDRCYKYGGCRMFLCQHNQQEDDEGDDLELENDWFTGNCDYCYRKIASRFRTVRMPLQMGGWVNNYCSMTCLKADSHREPRADEIDLNMIDALEKVLIERGVYDQPEHQLVSYEKTVISKVDISFVNVKVPEIEQEDDF